ncbi:MAG: CoA transferase [Dehalococcoidia bacterium]|nr:CoA transferase [Dehalococcoidia bacterium]MDP6782349.1 CoA transferase [Dehalococcoidia bacterium]
MRPALEGIRVIDFTRWGAAQCACAVLGDWGAEVIKIEEPVKGDPMRGIISSGVVSVTGGRNYYWEMDGRSKKSITLDLRQESARKVLCKLVEKADVFITSLLAGNLRKLKIDEPSLSPLNPRLIYVQFSAFGEEGEDGGRGAHGGAAFWARPGLMAVMGEPGETPSRGRPGLGDRIAGLYLAGGVALALLTRERDGVGQKVSLSLLGTGVWTNGYDIQASLGSGQDVNPVSRRAPGNPLWNCYQTLDGRWLVLTMLQTDPFWERFCRALERAELREDPRYASHEGRVTHNQALVALLDETFAARPLEDWAKRLNDNTVPWAAAQTTLEVTRDPQVLANDYIIPADAYNGEVPLVACPIRFSRTPARIQSPAPELGQHTEEVLLDVAGLNWDDIIQLRDEGAI